jgi:hypothetical protein
MGERYEQRQDRMKKERNDGKSSRKDGMQRLKRMIK